jgi:hypothetical protein
MQAQRIGGYERRERRGRREGRGGEEGRGEEAEEGEELDRQGSVCESDGPFQRKAQLYTAPERPTPTTHTRAHTHTHA